jgi:hypothetical protein
MDLYCARSIVDPVTGESRTATEQDDENQVVVVIVADAVSVLPLEPRPVGFTSPSLVQC